MFIRKRTYASKRGPTESYQVIESYREGGKVKQRQICNLEFSPTPAAALTVARKRLQAALDSANYQPKTPRDEQKRLKHLAVLRARITELKNVVAKMGTIGDVFDTTKKGIQDG